MQEYSIKKGFKEGLEERIEDGLKKIFETEAEKKNGHYQIEYGSFKCLEAWTNEKGNMLIIDTFSNISIYDNYSEEEADKIVLDTNSRFRKYLEYVTGYNTKERKKKASAAVKK